MIKLLKIFIFSFIFLFSISENVLASTSFLINSQSKNVSVGQNFSVSVYVSSPDQAMNAVSGVLKFSQNVSLLNINKNSSIIDFWTSDPKVQSGRIPFEGVVVNPGYQGKRGLLLILNLKAKEPGEAKFYLSEGAILANDGLGTNILDSLGSLSINVKSESIKVDSIPTKKPIAMSTDNSFIYTKSLPVITEYSKTIDSENFVFLKGKGEPNAITKISFDNSSIKSLGEKFIDSLQTKKKNLNDILIRNDENGNFEYTSYKNLLSGVYNTTVYLVNTDNNTEKPGTSIQLFIVNNKFVTFLINLINILLLLIPVFGLLSILYFIPWYSRLKMLLIKKKLYYEESRIENFKNNDIEHPNHLFDER